MPKIKSLEIDIYATKEEEDDSDECEVAYERSKGVNFLMHAQKWTLFLPETREENPLFWGDSSMLLTFR